MPESVGKMAEGAKAVVNGATEMVDKEKYQQQGGEL